MHYGSKYIAFTTLKKIPCKVKNKLISSNLNLSTICCTFLEFYSKFKIFYECLRKNVNFHKMNKKQYVLSLRLVTIILHFILN